MEDHMRGILISVAAAATGVALMTTVPASAQVGVEVGVPGVGVRVGEPDRYRERHDRVIVRENRGDCRTVTVRKERDDGTVITRRERRCD
jgi:hypothetical protein